MYIFRVIMAINLPKFASITQIFLKFYQFLVFSTIFFLCQMWLDWGVICFFKELKSGLESGLNRAKIDQKIGKNYICFQ